MAKRTHTTISISPKVHKQVVKIADANFRGVGDQIAYWAANDCPHPEDQRQHSNVQVALVEDGKVGPDQSLRIFRCLQCGRIVLMDEDVRLSSKFEALISSQGDAS